MIQYEIVISHISMSIEQSLGRGITAAVIFASTACGSGGAIQPVSGESQSQEQAQEICVPAQQGDTVLGIIGRYNEDPRSQVKLYRGIHTITKPAIRQPGLEEGDSVCFTDNPDSQ